MQTVREAPRAGTHTYRCTQTLQCRQTHTQSSGDSCIHTYRSADSQTQTHAAASQTHTCTYPSANNQVCTRTYTHTHTLVQPGRLTPQCSQSDGAHRTPPTVQSARQTPHTCTNTHTPLRIVVYTHTHTPLMQTGACTHAHIPMQTLRWT